MVTSLPPGIRVLNGWFQSASTRTAGFADVNLAGLHPAIQVSYLVMMYISVLPIAISVRRTNVYEERSLGVYGVDDEEDNGNQQSYVGAHLRRQLSFDLWYVFLGLFIIAIVEGDRLQNTNEFVSISSFLHPVMLSDSLRLSHCFRFCSRSCQPMVQSAFPWDTPILIPHSRRSLGLFLSLSLLRCKSEADIAGCLMLWTRPSCCPVKGYRRKNKTTHCGDAERLL